MSSYSSQLRDARWQRKRLEIMHRDEFTCVACSKGEDDHVTLNVHHAYYEKGKAPWEYPNRTLTTICEECHHRRHYAMQEVLVWIAGMDKKTFDGLICLAMGDYHETLQALHNAGDHQPYDHLVAAHIGNMSSFAHGRIDDLGLVTPEGAV